MNIAQWKHNADALQATLRELPNGSLVTTTGCRIVIQESFRAKQLISMGKRIMIIGFFAICSEAGDFAVATTPSMMEITPTEIRQLEYGGRSYYDFYFRPGSTVVKSIDLVKDNGLLYYLFEEILARGRIPFFYNYITLGSFFAETEEYTGTKLVATPTIGEMIIAQLARIESNRKVPLREHIHSYSELRTTPFTWIPLRNVVDGSSDTTAKISGSYTGDGLDSAIVNPNEVTQPIERLLRA
ncbi:hypothetical protein [Klebsiella pneumoniae]|uniref:hypothetical protein n=1 Tax=Klebsiella pneumoniae TaxID=573 RepID=UPI000D1AA865|nr:hypothetical protein [Klebsiella pneumoniae]